MRQSDPTMPPARGHKTLGWFMDQTDIFEKQQQQQLANFSQLPPTPVTMERRNSSSDDSKPPLNSSGKKQKRFRKTLSQTGAARKDGYIASQAMSESSEEGTQQVLPPPVTLTSTTTTTTTSGANPDEYWFYDVATDGYYYEQNGAKGWRRRQPNAAVHKGAKDQEVAHMNVNGPSKYNQLLAAQAAAAQVAFLQQAFHLQSKQAAPSTTSPANQPQQPTMRYYDPNSDGFFYEMASVDGWKRRQPNKPVSASVPAGITRPYSQRQADHQQQQQLQMMQAAAAALAAGASAPTNGSSYGAALARGQFPRNTVKSEVLTPAPESRDSASSSQCGDTFAELFGSSDPLFNPIQRPSALHLEQKAVSPQLENTNTQIYDAVKADFGQVLKPAAMTPSSHSPMKESWNSFRSCSLFSPIKPSSKRVLAPAPVTSNLQTPLIDEMDDTMMMLMKDLDKLWANTPVSGLNQA
uniref:Uncharacterized protein n=2 Tax=Caenorhabditis japonica TaxID=281687 RepID=A0A8R1HY54_CAEJA